MVKRSFMVALLLPLISFVGRSQGFVMPPQGKVEYGAVESKVLNTTRNYAIYLPKSYSASTSKEYPVLYLLHGMYDTHKGWSTRGHLEDVANQLVDGGEIKEMIIVTPDAGTDWNGYFDMEGWLYEKFFFQEFMPHIESKFRVNKARSQRALAGLSMGGGGSTVYAQKNPDLFSSVYAMSALMNIPFTGGPNPDKKMDLLTQSVIANSCIAFVEKADSVRIEKLKTVAWFVDCGDDDFLLDVNIDYVRAMKKAGVPLQFRVRDGGHTWEYWHSALYNALRFASRNFQN